MKWCLLFFYIIFCLNGQSVTNNERERIWKLGIYKKCMKNFGISNWKIVDPTFNATYFKIYNYQWNKIFEPVVPVAIFAPSTITDVQATVKCGFVAKIPLVPNSGGHSYAGISIGSNNSIIVDFRHMNSIKMNVKERSVTVGPGAFVGHINAKLWKSGGWGTPLGNCMTVAMGGHGTGGGVGYYSSLYGLVIDNILEIKMVDARGNAVTVNPTRNTDLWWAMRGIGPGYIGLVTSFRIKMFKAKGIKLTTVQLQYKLREFKNVMSSYFRWLEWVKQNEPSVMSVITAVHDNYSTSNQYLSPGIEVSLHHMQDPEIQPNCSTAFLAAFPKFFNKGAIKTIITYPSYIEHVVATSFTPVKMSQSDIQPNSPKPQSTSTNETLARKLEQQLNLFSTLTKEMALPRYSIHKSFFINRKFQARDLNEVQRVLSEVPNYTSGIMINSELGAISEPRATDSAYVHRNVLMNLRIRFDGINCTDIIPGKVWMDKFVKSTQFMDSGETYQNFPDIQLRDYLYRYYGINLRKIIRIKQKWDPLGYFNAKQSIPTFVYRF